MMRCSRPTGGCWRRVSVSGRARWRRSCSSPSSSPSAAKEVIEAVSEVVVLLDLQQKGLHRPVSEPLALGAVAPRVVESVAGGIHRFMAAARLAKPRSSGVQGADERQSRYFGRTKTKFQLYLAATVANLTLVAAKVGLPADTGGDTSVGSALRTGTIRSAFDFVPARLGQILTLVLLMSASLSKYISPNKAFRPDF